MCTVVFYWDWAFWLSRPPMDLLACEAGDSDLFLLWNFLLPLFKTKPSKLKPLSKCGDLVLNREFIAWIQLLFLSGFSVSGASCMIFILFPNEGWSIELNYGMPCHHYQFKIIPMPVLVFLDELVKVFSFFPGQHYLTPEHYHHPVRQFFRISLYLMTDWSLNGLSLQSLAARQIQICVLLGQWKWDLFLKWKNKQKKSRLGEFSF